MARKRDEFASPAQRAAAAAREEKWSKRETQIKLEQDLLELEMMLADMKYREKRRAAWPRAWGGIEEAFPTTPPKAQITLKLDTDLVRWFRGQRRGYQARMNAVLRAYWLAKKAGLGGSA